MALRYKLDIKIPKNTYQSSTYINKTVFINSYNEFVKPGTASASSPRFLDQVREQIQNRHYSLSMEKTYLYAAQVFHPLACAGPGH
jgi:hypothetical protein